jgi:hypothetical protein
MLDLVSLPHITKEAILANRSVFTTYNSLSHLDTTDWSPFKTLILSDLSTSGIHQYTFDWYAHDGEMSQWNQVIIFFTIKHWRFARAAFAFNKYGLDDQWNQDIYQIGIMSRWLTGRIEEVKNGFRKDIKVRQRHRTRKRREVSKKLGFTGSFVLIMIWPTAA